MKVHTQSVNFNADQKLLNFIQDRMDKLDRVYDKVIKSDVFLNFFYKNLLPLYCSLEKFPKKNSGHLLIIHFYFFFISHNLRTFFVLN